MSNLPHLCLGNWWTGIYLRKLVGKLRFPQGPLVEMIIKEIFFFLGQQLKSNLLNNFFRASLYPVFVLQLKLGHKKWTQKCGLRYAEEDSGVWPLVKEVNLEVSPYVC